jgi:hypothetical protein
VTSGPIPKYGNTHDVRIRITDGVDTWEARPYMVLQPWQEPEKKETKCYTFSDGTTRCTETTTRRSGKTGTDSEG